MTTSLIERSATRNEIVHADWTQELADELSVASEDSAKNGDVVEYWGTTDEGREWRVHLRVQA